MARTNRKFLVPVTSALPVDARSTCARCSWQSICFFLQVYGRTSQFPLVLLVLGVDRASSDVTAAQLVEDEIIDNLRLMFPHLGEAAIRKCVIQQSQQLADPLDRTRLTNNCVDELLAANTFMEGIERKGSGDYIDLTQDSPRLSKTAYGDGVINLDVTPDAHVFESNTVFDLDESTDNNLESNGVNSNVKNKPTPGSNLENASHPSTVSSEIHKSAPKSEPQISCPEVPKGSKTEQKGSLTSDPSTSKPQNLFSKDSDTVFETSMKQAEPQTNLVQDCGQEQRYLQKLPDEKLLVPDAMVDINTDNLSKGDRTQVTHHKGHGSRAPCTVSRCPCEDCQATPASWTQHHSGTGHSGKQHDQNSPSAHGVGFTSPVSKPSSVHDSRQKSSPARSSLVDPTPKAGGSGEGRSPSSTSTGSNSRQTVSGASVTGDSPSTSHTKEKPEDSEIPKRQEVPSSDAFINDIMKAKLVSVDAALSRLTQMCKTSRKSSTSPKSGTATSEGSDPPKPGHQPSPPPVSRHTDAQTKAKTTISVLQFADSLKSHPASSHRRDSSVFHQTCTQRLYKKPSSAAQPGTSSSTPAKQTAPSIKTAQPATVLYSKTEVSIQLASGVSKTNSGPTTSKAASKTHTSASVNPPLSTTRLPGAIPLKTPSGSTSQKPSATSVPQSNKAPSVNLIAKHNKNQPHLGTVSLQAAQRNAPGPQASNLLQRSEAKQARNTAPTANSNTQYPRLQTVPSYQALHRIAPKSYVPNLQQGRAGKPDGHSGQSVQQPSLQNPGQGSVPQRAAQRSVPTPSTSGPVPQPVPNPVVKIGLAVRTQQPVPQHPDQGAASHQPDQRNAPRPYVPNPQPQPATNQGPPAIVQQPLVQVLNPIPTAPPAVQGQVPPPYVPRPQPQPVIQPVTQPVIQPVLNPPPVIQPVANPVPVAPPAVEGQVPPPFVPRPQPQPVIQPMANPPPVIQPVANPVPPPIIQHPPEQPPGQMAGAADGQSIEQMKTEVLTLFPDVDPNYVLTKLREFQDLPSPVNQVCNLLLENPSYPRAKRQEAPPKPAEKKIQKEKVDFVKDYYKLCSPQTYQQEIMSLTQLQNDFRWISVDSIRTLWQLHNYHYAPTRLCLDEIVRTNENIRSLLPRLKSTSYNERKVKVEVTTKDAQGKEVKTKVFVQVLKGKRPSSCLPSQTILPQLQEQIACYEEHVKSIAVEKDLLLALSMNENEYEAEGQLIECGCCYAEVTFEKMIQCLDGHLFCDSCLKMYAKQAVYGQGKAALTCMTDGCDSSYPRDQLEKCLTATDMAKYDERVQEESIQLASIDGLVRCPHCDFAALLDPGDKVFACQNSDCRKETCRHCGEDWKDHFGKRCEEIEKKSETTLRTSYEERMSQKQIRTCHRCKTGIMKDQGCNKMTCRCGAKMCYICRKPNIDYNHFCSHARDPGQSCTVCTKCSLWTDPAEDDARAVKELEKELQAEKERFSRAQDSRDRMGPPTLAPEAKKQRVA